MGKYWSLVIVLLLLGCQNKISSENLILLNGYWEIEKVTLSNGETKEYELNTAVDYIQIKDVKGFRKKVYPKFDGSIDTSNDAEQFSIVEQNERFEIHYKTEFSTWVEVLKTLSEDSFSVTNTAQITYYYKRFEPVNVIR